MSNYNLTFKPPQPLVGPPPLEPNGGIYSSVNINKQHDSCVGQGATCGQVTVSSGQKGGQRGGRWPHWGCMSGGKYRKNRSTRRKTNKRRRRSNKRKETKKRR